MSTKKRIGIAVWTSSIESTTSFYIEFVELLSMLINLEMNSDDSTYYVDVITRSRSSVDD